MRYLADRIAVMYLGRIMEVGTTDEVFNGPHHPYTEALLSAVPERRRRAERAASRSQGEIPSPADPPSGCVFHTRCHRFIEGLCDVTEPPMLEVGNGHTIRCHIPADELVELQAKVARLTDRRAGSPPSHRRRAGRHAWPPAPAKAPSRTRRPSSAARSRHTSCWARRGWR